MVIRPVGGLCNCLRVTFSYLRMAEERGEDLTVIWSASDVCPGLFLDFFEPLAGVTFSDVERPAAEVFYRGFAVHPGYRPTYEGLRPLPAVRRLVDERRERLGDYIAVHVRRTDHIPMAKAHDAYTDDEMFFAFIERELRDRNLYVATDNPETYELFRSRYGGRILFDFHPTSESLRKTSLRDAIVDLYTCVDADAFLGSGWSSFSNLIRTLRRSRRDDAPAPT